EQIGIECVKRLPELEHRIVCDIRDIVDRTDSEKVESSCKPVRRRTNLHIGDIPPAVARTEIRLDDGNGKDIGGPVVVLLNFDFRWLDFGTVNGSDLARNAQVAQAIRTIRRYIQFKGSVVAMRFQRIDSETHARK